MKIKNLVLSSLVVLPLIAASGAMAATATKDAMHAPAVAQVDETANTKYDQMKQDAVKRRKDRKLAGSPELTEASLQPDYKAVRDAILTLDTSKVPAISSGSVMTQAQMQSSLKAQALDNLLTKAEADYAGYSPDTKFLVAQLLPLRAFKSIVYRTRPWVKDTNIIHSMLLSSVRQLMTASHVFLPTETYDAATTYITEPMNGMGPIFTSEEDVARYLRQELFPAIGQAVTRLLDLRANFAPNSHMIADNQLLYGAASYQDGIDRYRQVGIAEINTTLSGLNSSLALISMSSAYAMDRLLAVAKEEGNLFGIDGFRSTFTFNKEVEGAPSRDRITILKKPENASFLTLRGAIPGDTWQNDQGPKSGADWMKYAWNYYRASVNESLLAWNEVKDLPASSVDAINPGFVSPYNRWITLGETNVRAMLQGPTAIRSAVTGETVTVDLPSFFVRRPPPDLKAFLPLKDGFDTSAKMYTKTIVDSSGKSQTFSDCRNYAEGSSKQWDAGEYQHYFPGLKGDQVPFAARVLSNAWGAGSAGLTGAIL